MSTNFKSGDWYELATEIPGMVAYARLYDHKPDSLHSLMAFVINPAFRGGEEWGMVYTKDGSYYPFLSRKVDESDVVARCGIKAVKKSNVLNGRTIDFSQQLTSE